jgi:hypothetical protein
VLLLALLLAASAGRAAANHHEEPSTPAAAELLAQADPGTTPGYTGTGERPVEMERRVQKSRFQYLMLGYGLVWVSLGAYLFGLNRKIGRVGGEIADLRDRLREGDRGGR